MKHEEWIALGCPEQWRAVINTTLFKQACSVVLERLYEFRTTGDVQANALQNQFKEGTYSAINTLRALADPAHKKFEPPKPWEHAARPELEKQLPTGPKQKDLIRE